MKKILCTIALAFGLVACEDLDGVMTVLSPLQVIDKDGDNVTLQMGTYNSEFEYKEDKRELKIKIKDAIDGDDDVKLVIKVPAGTLIQDNSDFTIQGTQINQPWNLNGSIRTTVQNSPQYNTTESCTYTVYVYQQYQVPIYNNQGQIIGYQTQWTYVPYTQYGLQTVSYYERQTSVKVQSEFLKPTDGLKLADMAGSETWAEKVYTFIGTCH